jgi:lipoate-protein ligase A
MRREVGGGATYLDGNQIFYQLIWKKDNPRFPRVMKESFPWFSEAPVETYRNFGIQAEYRAINDIVTQEGERSQEKAAETSVSVWSLWGEFFSISTTRS